MKRRLSFFIVLCIMSTFIVSYTAAEGDLDNAIVMYVDSSLALVNNQEKYIDEDKSIQPLVEKGRTLVPVRFIAENFNMTVNYNESDRLVTVSNDSYNIQFIVGSNTIIVNGHAKLIDNDNLDIIAKEVNGRTLIPMRCFAEAIGKKVFYDRGLIIISDNENIYNAETDKTALDSLIKRVNVLPTVGSAEYLSELVGSYKDDTRYYTKESLNGNTKAVFDSSVQPAASAAPVPTPSPALGGSVGAAASKAEHSETNIQVQGVDEADVVKTDGNYLYQVNNQRIIITKVNPVSQMSITSVIKHEKEQFNPNEIYIDGDKLIIMASVYKYDEPIVYDSANKMAPTVMPRYRNNNFTQCTVYNIADKSNPVLERTLEVEGNYLSSRKINNIVYLVSNQYLNYGIYNKTAAVSYMDNNKEIEVGFDKVRYFPGFTSKNYLTIASIDINQPDKEAKVETLLGGGENLYVSKNNMYVATTTYGGDVSTTNVYKFSLDNGNITYLKKGSVEGNILNQFSMDEYNGYFRIATTTNGWQQSNNLFILDDTMAECGNIRSIAPGERIYSVRFVGNRGYMVTFKQVDPLFVIDLANPYKPEILGNLKIPGYSDYIHPIDENNILGFGKDATNEGLYQGMKMAMFDVSDVTSPKQKFSEIIGDRGTESALLQTHKALLYAPEHNLLAFPVTVREVTQNDRYNSQYGQLTFSGVYVYSFDTENGFKLKGKISHLTKEDMLKLGNYVDYNKEISRILYAGNSLLTTSNTKIQANSIDTIEYQNSIDIPEK